MTSIADKLSTLVNYAETNQANIAAIKEQTDELSFSSLGAGLRVFVTDPILLQTNGALPVAVQASVPIDVGTVGSVGTLPQVRALVDNAYLEVKVANSPAVTVDGTVDVRVRNDSLDVLVVNQANAAIPCITAGCVTYDGNIAYFSLRGDDSRFAFNPSFILGPAAPYALPNGHFGDLRVVTTTGKSNSNELDTT